MLAHFKYFDFSSLLEYFYVGHILLFNLLYGNFDTCFNLSCHFNKAELTLTYRLLESVKIKHILVPQYFL